MRFTQILYAQHIGWQFKQLWKQKGQRVPIDTGARAVLEGLGIKIDSIEDVLNLNPKSQVEQEEATSSPVAEQPLAHVVSDGTVLLEGLPQAQTLLNTFAVESFPSSLQDKLNDVVPHQVHQNVKAAVLFSQLLDSERKKLERETLPERPAYVLPRKFGITDKQRNRSLSTRLLFECEKLCARSTALQRRVAHDLTCNLNLKTEKNMLQLDFRVETLITSKHALSPVNFSPNADLPDIFPLKSTVSIPHTKKYEARTTFPLTSLDHPHTLLLDFSRQNVRNLYDKEVTDSQFQARNMLKAFGVAAARAKQLFGEKVKSIEIPIVVQSIHTNGKQFHFGIYQLNTLDFDAKDGKMNYWFHEPTCELFHECKYELGQPILKGYNEKVFNCLNSFYCNS